MSLLKALNKVLKFRITSYWKFSQAEFRLRWSFKKPHDYSEKLTELECFSYIKC
ncbi:Uncharacterised protein [Acinetobacter baumannii]|uniref:Uncharacterized protein n=1 Tax=Acinetobacter baumannii TaxID=470 RepID=A0A333W9P3_ACIBA|nr:Uncharacterised protein [Acinetobacter baumannii]SST32864.1 Uncharacterised protein [Acinetobacter baumannii]